MPTPWPSWLIAAHPTRAPAEALRPFLATLSEHVRAFDAAEQRAGPDVAFIKDKFGYPEADIQVRSLLSRVRQDGVDGPNIDRRGSRRSVTRPAAPRSRGKSS